MNSKDYIKEAIKTEAKNFSDIKARLSFNDSTIRILHAGLGMVTESGEFLDVLKKLIFYNKPVDITNLKEEIGDIFWYLAIVCDTLGVSFEEIIELNIKKLHKRYEKKDGSKDFSEAKAINRNLAGERKILEYKPLFPKES